MERLARIDAGQMANTINELIEHVEALEAKLEKKPRAKRQVKKPVEKEQVEHAE